MKAIALAWWPIFSDFEKVAMLRILGGLKAVSCSEDV